MHSNSLLVGFLENSFEDVPRRVVTGLTELGRRDRITRTAITQLAKEETCLLECLEKEAKENSNFDEKPFIVMAEKLNQRRNVLAQLLEEQSKLSQQLYDLMDTNIALFHSCGGRFGVDFGESNDINMVKKKKKRKSVSAEVDLLEAKAEFERGISEVVTNANEPRYCSCNRISYGEMVACDNEDCPIEWYHFACVGLTVAPETWLCPLCDEKSKKMARPSTTTDRVVDAEDAIVDVDA